MDFTLSLSPPPCLHSPLHTMYNNHDESMYRPDLCIDPRWLVKNLPSGENIASTADTASPNVTVQSLQLSMSNTKGSSRSCNTVHGSPELPSEFLNQGKGETALTSSKNSKWGLTGPDDYGPSGQCQNPGTASYHLYDDTPMVFPFSEFRQNSTGTGPKAPSDFWKARSGRVGPGPHASQPDVGDFFQKHEYPPECSYGADTVKMIHEKEYIYDMIKYCNTDPDDSMKGHPWHVRSSNWTTVDGISKKKTTVIHYEKAPKQDGTACATCIVRGYPCLRPISHPLDKCFFSTHRQTYTRGGIIVKRKRSPYAPLGINQGSGN